MIACEIKSKVDRIWALLSGGISNSLIIIGQLTYLLFINNLYDLYALKEKKANRLKKLMEGPMLTPKQDRLRWSHFKETSPEEMFASMRGYAFPFIAPPRPVIKPAARATALTATT